MSGDHGHRESRDFVAFVYMYVADPSGRELTSTSQGCCLLYSGNLASGTPAPGRATAGKGPCLSRKVRLPGAALVA
ncbi:hypothetical protein TgHK011_004673 [Trichoderma gracile]|nr:hypothetical protein TgHK011_004673 [Trichoderma gracile]